MAALAVLVIAVVAVNFDKITGNQVATASRVEIWTVPEAVTSGQKIQVMVNANDNRIKVPLKMRKVGGIETRSCEPFDNCASNSWCDGPAFGEPGSTLVTECRTSANWEGGYVIEAEKYQGRNEILGRAYFTVT